jgi:hypothetical protein
MKESRTVVSFAIGGLAIVNVALAVALWARSSEPTANAQVGGRVDIIAVSARNAMNNNPGSIVMLDSNSGILALMRPDTGGRIVKLVARRSVAQDMGRQ